MRTLNLPADPANPDDTRRIRSKRARFGMPIATICSGSLVVNTFMGVTRGHAISRAENFAARHRHTPSAEFHQMATSYWSRWWRT